MTKKTIPVILIMFFVLSASACGRSALENPQQYQESSIDFDSATVSYLGPEGTYTQEACGTFFDKKGSYLPFETVSDAVDAMEAGQTDYAVIPQENTIGGAVTDYVDIVISHTDVSVVGEVELPINQNLLVIPGTTLNEIKTVYSHKQGIAQGKDWLAKNLPNAEVIEVSSTAEGARLVSESQDKSIAAIASAACSDVYGLEILASAIQENDSNKTRFYVLSTENPPVAGADRMSFVAEGSAKDIPALLTEMEKSHMTLVALHDRPRKTELGEYYYLIECSDCDYQDFEALKGKSPMELRFLGCFSLR
ncbi:prephenate dehydratase [Butyrivibrio sp. VCB2001]|uniref:prephenate dehydratase n=1 Tax=Butyrivibrio sp. VCB2001 TaxID=1280667 RepID=UPI00047D083C|nr:prephenate dehydratase domain-containing protein [Butyrivibrio sp. VCB2001]